jgi:hypothetical protein
MPEAPKPSLAEIEAFARRHGLEKLAPEHVARMAELAVYVSDLGCNLSRPPRKENAPAASFRPDPSRAGWAAVR